MNKGSRKTLHKRSKKASSASITATEASKFLERTKFDDEKRPLRDAARRAKEDFAKSSQSAPPDESEDSYADVNSKPQLPRLEYRGKEAESSAAVTTDSSKSEKNHPGARWTADLFRKLLEIMKTNAPISGSIKNVQWGHVREAALADNDFVRELGVDVSKIANPTKGKCPLSIKYSAEKSRYSLFLRLLATSGVGWDPQTQTVDAPHGFWVDEKNKDFVEFRHQPYEFYEEMSEYVGNAVYSGSYVDALSPPDKRVQANAGKKRLRDFADFDPADASTAVLVPENLPPPTKKVAREQTAVAKTAKKTKLTATQTAFQENVMMPFLAALNEKSVIDRAYERLRILSEQDEWKNARLDYKLVLSWFSGLFGDRKTSVAEIIANVLEPDMAVSILKDYINDDT